MQNVHRSGSISGVDDTGDVDFTRAYIQVSVGP
jgi:hypothetical protein